MEKVEPAPQRFRRRAKGPGSSSGASERASPHSGASVDSLLCDTLLGDSLPDSHTSLPSATHTSPPNSTCDVEPTDGDTNAAAAVDAPRPDPELQDQSEDPAPPGAPDLSSLIPAELAGLERSEISPLCSAHRLLLSSCHIQQEDSVALVVFVHNSSDSDVLQLQLELDSDELQVE